MESLFKKLESCFFELKTTFVSVCYSKNKPFFKGYFELLLSYFFISRLTSFNQNIKNENLVHCFLSLVNDNKDYEAYVVQNIQKNPELLLHCVFHNLENSQNQDHYLYKSLKKLVSLDPFLGYDGLLFFQIEKLYKCRYIGFSLSEDVVQQAVFNSLNLVYSELNVQVSRDALYLLTHIVFYLTDFGFYQKSLCSVNKREFLKIRAFIRDLVVVVKEHGHWDILGEIGLCALFLGDKALAKDILIFFENEKDFLSHRDVQCFHSEKDMFFLKYHTFLVIFMLYYGYHYLPETSFSLKDIKCTDEEIIFKRLFAKIFSRFILLSLDFTSFLHGTVAIFLQEN